jgi:hypothetical protein
VRVRLLVVQSFAVGACPLAISGGVPTVVVRDLSGVGIQTARLGVAGAFAFRAAGLVGQQCPVAYGRIGVAAGPVAIDRGMSAVLRGKPAVCFGSREVTVCSSLRRSVVSLVRSFVASLRGPRASRACSITKVAPMYGRRNPIAAINETLLAGVCLTFPFVCESFSLVRDQFAFVRHALAFVRHRPALLRAVAGLISI